jgi:hypothetical protein
MRWRVDFYGAGFMNGLSDSREIMMPKVAGLGGETSRPVMSRFCRRFPSAAVIQRWPWSSTLAPVAAKARWTTRVIAEQQS